MEGYFPPLRAPFYYQQNPGAWSENYRSWWSQLPEDLRGQLPEPGCLGIFPEQEIRAYDPYVLIHYWNVREFELQKKGAFTPALSYEVPLPLPIGGGIVPITAGSKTTEYAVDTGTDRYVEHVWKGYIGVGVKGGHIGLDLQYTAPKSVTPGVYGAMAECSVRLTFGSFSAGCEGARLSLGWTPRVDRYILTKKSDIVEAGGSRPFGRQFVFPRGEFNYEVLKEALNPGEMYAMWGANVEELP